MSSGTVRRFLREVSGVKGMLNPVEYGYDARQPLQGIIAHLTQACGGNVHEQDVVKATASSFIAGREPQNAVDLGTISNFCSRNARESWISYDFRARRVLPTSYTIRSCGAGAGVAILDRGYSRARWMERSGLLSILARTAGT